MFKIFGDKPDHPLFNLAEAKRLLGELPKNDAKKSLEEITFWLESIKSVPGFSPEQRNAIIMLLDEAGQPLQTELLQRYLSEPHLRDFQGLHLWQGIHAFVLALSEAYTSSISEYRHADKKPREFRERMPLVCVRQMLAVSEQMKLELLRYIEVGPEVWQLLYACYQYTVTEQCAEKMLLAYPGHVIHTSAQRELLRTLVLYISSPGTLAADQIEVSYRIAGRLASFFDLKTAPDADCHYVFDLSSHVPPRKVDSGLQVTPGMRFFGAVRALPALKKIFDQNESDPVWQERRFSSEFTPAGKLTVLKHLLGYWASEPPQRHTTRRDISATIDVTHGFRVISHLVTHIDAGHFADQDAGDSEKLAKIDLEAAADVDYTTETWDLSDMSSNGIGVTLSGLLGAWIKIGNLCALKPKNGQMWWVGMIRRLHTGEQSKVHVGIELLAKRPASVWLRVLGKGADRVSHWETSSGSFAYDYLPAILLPDAQNAYQNATMLMESGHFVMDALYQVMMGEQSRDIKLTRLIGEGEDYEQVGFEWLS
jgi:hypothetical protein